MGWTTVRLSSWKNVRPLPASFAPSLAGTPKERVRSSERSKSGVDVMLMFVCYWCVDLNARCKLAKLSRHESPMPELCYRHAPVIV